MVTIPTLSTSEFITWSTTILFFGMMIGYMIGWTHGFRHKQKIKSKKRKEKKDNYQRH